MTIGALGRSGINPLYFFLVLVPMLAFVSFFAIRYVYRSARNRGRSQG